MSVAGVAPSERWSGGLLYAIAAIGLASAVFAYRQNVLGQVGGPISIEKSLWLNYTMTAWIVVPLSLARHAALDPATRRVFMGLLVSMLARTLVELPLIYVTFGWSPLYGIAHDLFTIGLVGALRQVARTGPDATHDAFHRAARRYSAVIQLAFGAEIVFAALFYRMAVHERAVYFAAATEEFRHINLLTRWVDVAVYSHLAHFLWTQRRPLLWTTNVARRRRARPAWRGTRETARSTQETRSTQEVR